MTDPKKGLADAKKAPAGNGIQPLYTVRLARTELEDVDAAVLWVHTLTQSETLSFDSYNRFINRVLCNADDESARITGIQVQSGLDPYELLKTATEAFLLTNVGTWDGQDMSNGALATMLERNKWLGGLKESGVGLTEGATEEAEARGYGIGADDLGLNSLQRYLSSHHTSYLDAILPHLGASSSAQGGGPCQFIAATDASLPCLLELIWSYWHEEGMLSQTLNAIARRFQNVRRPGGANDPLAELELAPLRPLSTLLWGYVNDEQQRLSVRRRAYEYQHHYGLSLVGKATEGLSPADSRSRFIEAFHELLRRCAQFYLQDDDATVTADAFPILQALKEVHLVLAEGAHNQFRDLPWTARAEMLMEQWLLARPEMRDFLRGRWMMPYPEPWMGGVDAMKRVQGWSDTSVLHFRDLGTYGERLLLSIRYYAWMNTNNQQVARTWARFWRPEVQSYLHAYRVVTGVDLAGLDYADATMPSELLQRRLAEQRRYSMGNGMGGNGETVGALSAATSAMTTVRLRGRRERT
ncbi:hypothetical protein [Gemmatimonas groenlandica]|uniref:Uncharacterized protein n=1 Tax=Gemmatimonas groenlandica TaxID=2732249 RepID=A0A6M4IQD0_9BACT|nr:hypothetical protein [Gemmatimonas groenlandica]QJR35697.1 hypothetical protein HKW67_09320 [Gemmatimonas groenlandica]